MSYLAGPHRPRWFKPVLITWVLSGLPAIPMGMMYAGSLSPVPMPPRFESFADAATWGLVAAWLYVTPVILVVAERRYRRVSDMEKNAQH
jgi:hypothetical protein